MELYNHEIERNTLGLLADLSQLDGPEKARLLLEQSAIRGDLFHLPAHRDLFEAITASLHEGQPADASSLAGRLKGSRNVEAAGGPSWVAEVVIGSGMAVSGALAGYSRELVELTQRRTLAALAKSMFTQATSPNANPDATIREISQGLASITSTKGSVRSMREVMGEIIDELDEIQNGNKRPIIESGIDVLDKVIGGLQETLTVIGALPGVGKSALIGTIIRNLAQRGVKTGIFSLEDKDTWLPWRYLAAETDISQFVLRNRRLNAHQMKVVGDACERIWSYGEHVLIDDRSALSPQDVVAGARDMILNRGVQVLFVDHLGELRYTNGRKDRFDLDVADGLSDLRAIAKTYRVPVICATHLKREVEARKEVRLTDFANSAAIERQARVALGLSREPGDGRLVVSVLKQTNGIAGVKVALDFHGSAGLVKPDGGEELGG